jgi:hypothetical protein
VGKILQWFGLQEAAELPNTAAQHERAVYESAAELAFDRLAESFARLELARENQGWTALREQYRDSFTREGLRTAAEDGRLFGVANPIIKRGREARHAYIWGQGVTIDARDATVNDFIQAFMDDEGNREALFGAQAKANYEGALYDEGNFFIANFTNPLTGRVQVRTIPFDEIVDVITKPGDKLTPWYYKRRWTETDASGKTIDREMLYPSIKYQPATRYKSIDEIAVDWFTPIRHVKVNANSDWKFGIGDSYAALPWALSHKGFLEDWALLMKALSKIAFQTSSKSAGEAQMKRKSLQGMSELPAGSSVSMSGETKIEAVSKSGATLDSESSRPLATMAASALGLPVTIILADPGQTGARATAETLDLPTRLTMEARQQLHSEVLRDVIGYAVEQSVLAPRGELRGLGKPYREEGEDRLKVLFNDPDDTSVNVTWPSLEEVDVKTVMDAIIAAEGMPEMPRLPLIRLALNILKIDDVDELIDKITDADGELIEKDPEVTAGDVATKAFRNGQNPAEALK